MPIDLDLYFPVFTVLQFFFFMGLLKVKLDHLTMTIMVVMMVTMMMMTVLMMTVMMITMIMIIEKKIMTMRRVTMVSIWLNNWSNLLVINLKEDANDGDN